MSKVLEQFERSVRYHFANSPQTWTVRKADDRRWQVVNAAGDVVTSATTKRQAEQDLTSGSYYRIWHERNAWYLGTSADPRNRALTDEELAVIARVTEH